MGQSKGGGYIKQDTLTPDVVKLLQQLTGNAQPQIQGAAEGYKQFLPGGGGGQAITDAANKNYQQKTLPSILNAFGSNSKGGSALNQALGASAANLNTDLASQLAQMQLSAAGGLGSLGLSQAGLSAQTPQFAYQQQQTPFWQQALLGTIGAGGDVLGGWLGKPK